MVDSEIKIDKNNIETYLVKTFSKIHDEYGQTLDITLALPTLVEVMSGSNQAFDDKKYNFIGEAACQFAIRCILAKQYAHFDNSILDALAKKFRALQRMNSLIFKEIDLKRNIDRSLPLNVIQVIAGILFTFVGLPAVEKFIEKSVLQISAIELGQATSTTVKLQHNQNPLERFNILISAKGGSVKTVASETPGKQWQVELIAKLRPTSVLFSHTRIGGSKNKAKSAASQDVLNYLEKNPEVYKQLELPDIESDQVHPLPIIEADYSGFSDSVNTCNNSSHIDPNNIHVSLNHDEDAVKQLSRLLLGDGSDIDDEDMVESPTKKRMRDHSQHESMKGVECMFSNGNSNTNTIKTEETFIKTENTPILNIATTTNNNTNFNLFVGAEPTVDINPKIIKYFKDIFKNPNNTLAHAVSMPSQSKSTFLSLVVKNQDQVQCDSSTKQVGPPHEPVFSAEVILKSKKYDNVFILTDGIAKKKKDAECVAFHKLVLLLH